MLAIFHATRGGSRIVGAIARRRQTRRRRQLLRLRPSSQGRSACLIRDGQSPRTRLGCREGRERRRGRDRGAALQAPPVPICSEEATASAVLPPRKRRERPSSGLLLRRFAKSNKYIRSRSFLRRAETAYITVRALDGRR